MANATRLATALATVALLLAPAVSLAAHHRPYGAFIHCVHRVETTYWLTVECSEDVAIKAGATRILYIWPVLPTGATADGKPIWPQNVVKATPHVNIEPLGDTPHGGIVTTVRVWPDGPLSHYLKVVVTNLLDAAGTWHVTVLIPR